MRIVFINQEKLRIVIGIVLLVIIVTGFWLNSGQMTRRILGVKKDVSLEGTVVTGMLPEEVTELVAGLAEQVDREPREASYFPETGEVIPARVGRQVHIAATVRRVCRARAGERLRLVTVSVPPRISNEFFEAVYHGNRTKPQVALAVNVAWGEEYLPEMLKICAEQQVKLSFFIVGDWGKLFPELLKAMANAGHELANHGLYHGHPLQMNPAELRRLIIENETLITKITGRKPARLFAPPYGEVDSRIVATAGAIGYRTIMWSVDTVDWKKPTPEILLKRVLSKIGPGGIILMHPTIASRQALPELIRSLKQRGLQLVTVSEILK